MEAAKNRFNSCDHTLLSKVQQDLAELKRSYINTYLEMHTKARLGVEGDKKKKALMNDERLKTLRDLASIDLMPQSQLMELEDVWPT